MSGSLRQRGKSKDAWELKFEAGADPATGAHKTVYRAFRGTRRQTEARLIELQGEAPAACWSTTAKRRSANSWSDGIAIGPASTSAQKRERGGLS
jgi:hypothetical protein